MKILPFDLSPTKESSFNTQVLLYDISYILIEHNDYCVISHISCLPLWRNALGHMFPSRLCHSRQTHRFRWCSVVAVGAFEYPQDKFQEWQ